MVDMATVNGANFPTHGMNRSIVEMGRFEIRCGRGE